MEINELKAGSKEHYLKTWPEFLKPIERGQKAFELRKNDRDFSVGDNLILCEWCPISREYSGRQITVKVTYIVYGPRLGLEAGYACMSIVIERLE